MDHSVAELFVNGETVHDLFAEKIMKSSRNRRISFWIGRLTSKSRLIFGAIINNLEKKNILKTEQKKFLNIFLYKRYWFTDNSVRTSLIELLRGILLYGKQAGKKEIMLLGLIEASKAYSVLSHEKEDKKILRKKNSELLKSDVISAEISQAIREVQAAIVASITSASVAAASSSH